jgi:hypothetical protein
MFRFLYFPFGEKIEQFEVPVRSGRQGRTNQAGSRICETLKPARFSSPLFFLHLIGVVRPRRSSCRFIDVASSICLSIEMFVFSIVTDRICLSLKLKSSVPRDFWRGCCEFRRSLTALIFDVKTRCAGGCRHLM